MTRAAAAQSTSQGEVRLLTLDLWNWHKARSNMSLTRCLTWSVPLRPSCDASFLESQLNEMTRNRLKDIWECLQISKTTPAEGARKSDGCPLSLGAKTPLSMRRSKPALRNRVVNLALTGPGNKSARGSCSLSSSGRGQGNAATARHWQPRFRTASEWLRLCVSHRTGSKSCKDRE